MAQSESDLNVEVVYALPERQVCLALTVAAGTTVHEALLQSGIARCFPELDLAGSPVGIFGKRVARDTLLKDGDRIEIYRPLVADAKAIRRKRVRKKP